MKTGFFRVRPKARAASLMYMLAFAAQPADRLAGFAVPESQMQALGIATAPIHAQGDPVRLSFPAQVVVPPAAAQVVSAPVAGLVTQLLVQQNQGVRRGTPLIRIASPELGHLQLQLLQTSARATLARQTAQREKQLFDEGIIPQRRVQESHAALAEAQAALNNATAALRMSGMPAATIEAVASTGKTQDTLTLAATQAGFVIEVAVKPGQRVEAATALMQVAQTDTLWLDIQLPVSESANWPAGTRVSVKDRKITARIVSANSMVSPASQTITVRAAIEGRDSLVRPGEFLTVELPAGTAQRGWDVPLAALAHEGDQAYLFVRTAKGFEARPVTVTASAGQRARVQGPVEPGEQIAVSGVVALKGAWLAGKAGK